MRVVRVASSVALILTVTASAGPAQVLQELKTQSVEEIAKGQTDFWARSLGLTDEQTAELHQINLRYAASQSLAARVPGEDDQKVDGLDTLEEQKTAEMLEILTSAQRERYLSFSENMARWVRKDAASSEAQ
jgi:hypothetical protein